MTSPDASLIAALGDRFEFGPLLGKGGMAEVYRAEDRRTGPGTGLGAGAAASAHHVGASLGPDHRRTENPMGHYAPIRAILILAASLLCAAQPALLFAQIDPCKLLTREQVATVLPNHDGGSVVYAGASLIKGVNAYQCSYADTVFHFLTVVLNVAVDDKRFAEIRPGSTITEEQKVPVADGGWIWGSPGDMKLKAVKGRTVIDLELMAPGADQKGPALVTLGNAIAGKL